MRTISTIFFVFLTISAFTLITGCSEDSNPLGVENSTLEQSSEPMSLPEVGDIMAVNDNGIIRYYIVDSVDLIDGEYFITWHCVDKAMGDNSGAFDEFAYANDDTTSGKGEGEPEPEQVSWSFVKSLYQ